ncbi:lck-interacting transmembrane adapter 1 [Hyperolius riggenbachi]|uniref:lck-interacting transmembrane adapter 1 n=1 Tax=Hyperolius riggenbachi TaxID=752182 RepID=UPI0035A2B931
MAPVASGQALSALCSAVGLVLLLCSLCTFCKRRKRRRFRNTGTTRVALVDVTLLRQTQLRSLSKSDTRLHEIKRPRPGETQLRPVSMDPLYHPSVWPLPATDAKDDATYSNINYTPTPQKSSLYECVGSRTDLEASYCEPEADTVTAEYAVVCKVKKGMNGGLRESKREAETQSLTPSEQPALPHRPDDLEVEAMYSQVNKKKKLLVRENAQVSVRISAEHMSQPAYPPLQPEENFYETI